LFAATTSPTTIHTTTPSETCFDRHLDTCRTVSDRPERAGRSNVIAIGT